MEVKIYATISPEVYFRTAGISFSRLCSHLGGKVLLTGDIEIDVVESNSSLVNAFILNGTAELDGSVKFQLKITLTKRLLLVVLL